MICNHRTRLCLGILASLAMSGSVAARAAESADRPDLQELNKRLGGGVNIIGYDPLWRSRDNARFQEKHFRLIAEAGFNHVRVNLHPWRDRKIDSQDRLAADWLETLDWVVKQARESKLLAILDLHEFQAMGRDAEGNRQRLISATRSISARPRRTVFRPP
jgi:endoglucanase